MSTEQRPTFFDRLNTALTEFTPAGYLILCFLASSLISVFALAFMAVASSRYEGGRASLEARIAALEQGGSAMSKRVDTITEVVLHHGEELEILSSPTAHPETPKVPARPRPVLRPQSIAQETPSKEDRNWGTLDAKLAEFSKTLQQTPKELKK